MEDKLEEALRLPLAGKPQRDLLRRFYANFSVSDFCRCVDFILDHEFSWISSAERQAAKEVAEAAKSTMGGNLYHSPEHAFHVAFVALLLAGKYGRVTLHPRLRFLLFLGALGHDIGHDGRMDSTGSFALEAVSADHVCRLLETFGFPAGEVALVRNLILATCAPHRKLVMHLVDAVEANCLEVAVAELDIPEKLSALRHQKCLIRLCGILSDSDLFFSVALGADTSHEQSERVFAEADAWSGKPSDHSVQARRQAFFRYVVTSNFASAAGSEFSPSLEDLWREAFDENISLRTTSLSKRYRYLGAAERKTLRDTLFAWAGGFDGYKRCARLLVDGHLIIHRDKRAIAMTRSGLILEGCMNAGIFQGASFAGVIGK